ncbi:YrzA family protein [Paenibacillus sp. J5C_2022]|uniref:YrzA family protein n=1 Tax=Paenibacillus sp. J5C2022 TaxID=2977129 RepID=UPI0021D33E8D|nr:YrzA family protein [Paenibacillus sp. J5C2022]MCU6709509.1 YrzA family protein [Paenibacillus sp. J5C2022]
MEFHLDLIDTKIEFFEAETQKTLEDQIRYAIDTNKALMLDVHAVQYQTAFNHRTEKMHYSAAVHFKLKR